MCCYDPPVHLYSPLMVLRNVHTPHRGNVGNEEEMEMDDDDDDDEEEEEEDAFV